MKNGLDIRLIEGWVIWPWTFNYFVVLAQIKRGFGLSGEWAVSDYEISKYHQVKLSDMDRTIQRNIMSDEKCTQERN